jgi:hypothetical protein
MEVALMSLPPKALLVSALLVLACGDGVVTPNDDNTGTEQGGLLANLPADQQRAVRLAVMTLAIATADEGHSFFDNFLPCARRGVVNFHNTATGRHATFSGCDIGGGYTVDGSGDVEWVGSGLAQSRQEFCRFAQTAVCGPALVWSGDLTVSAGGSSVQITGFRVSAIAWASNGGLFPAGLAIHTGGFGLRGLEVTLHEETTRVEDDDLPARIFDVTDMDINSIPNASREPSVLTDVDLKRLVYHGSIVLLSFLVDETLEIQRGNHTHQLECGSSVVTPNPDGQTTRIENTWTECHFSFGLFMSGTFSIEWGEVDFDSGPLTMVVEGNLDVGGGIPTTTIRRLEWTAAGVDGALTLPGEIRISGTIDGPAEQRAFSLEVFVDD